MRARVCVTERQRQTDRQTNRQTETEQGQTEKDRADTKKSRHRDRRTDRLKGRKRNKETNRQTKRHAHTSTFSQFAVFSTRFTTLKGDVDSRKCEVIETIQKSADTPLRNWC